jgi:hypothetical protein
LALDEAGEGVEGEAGPAVSESEGSEESSGGAYGY